MQKFNTIIVTGGAGFIGSNFIRHVFTAAKFQGTIVNVDALTYAGNPYSLDDIAKDSAYAGRYVFEKVDIRDSVAVNAVFDKYQPDAVVHFAAESHVDRSITGPRAFIETNVLGTFNLLEATRQQPKPPRFHHVSTDEVYGSLGDEGFFTENTSYDPRSPYSASKASSDHLVRAYYHTYGLNVTISNCSNNYGPYHFPEKLIPVMILNMLEKKNLPVYGDGKNIRDWLYVVDHGRAIWDILNTGVVGQTYNVGGENEWENLTLVKELCRFVAEELQSRSWPAWEGSPWAQKPTQKDLESPISFVKDRPGHDRRYAIDCSKIKKELGWKQQVTFEEGLRNTVRWYLDNPAWVAQVRDGSYRQWMESNYTRR